MSRPHPLVFRQRAVELARLRREADRQIAEDLGIAEWSLRNWMKQADIDDGAPAGSHGGRLLRQFRGRELLRTLQLELLDEHRWENGQQLAMAIFE